MKIKNARILKFFCLKIIRFIRKPLLNQVDELYIRKLDRELCQDATWNLNYIILTISSCLIATFGLISNSTAVIIGAMLVAPLMLPLRALAFGALEGNFTLFKRAFWSILRATILSLIVSYMAGDAANIPQFGSEVLSRTQPNLVDLGIAVVAGGISSFAKVRKGVSDVLAGTAIAVALMPPLCVVGLALSQQQLSFAKGAFILYLTNLLGITLSCMMVFILAGYTRINHALAWTLALTGVLVLPLGASFVKLVRQAKLTQGVTDALNMTITVSEGVDKAVIEVDWTENPPVVYILLQTDKEVFPNQVGLVEEFIEKRMGQPFKLVFFVNKFAQVTAEEAIETDTETEPEIPRETDTESEPEIPRETDTESELEIPRETEPESEPETPTETEPESELEAPIKTNLETELEAPTETEPESEPETPIKTDLETELEAPTETEPESELEAPTETEPESEPETPIKTDLETELEAPTETEPESEPETPTETDADIEPEPVEKKSVPRHLIVPSTPSSPIYPYLRLNKPPKKKIENVQ